MVSEVTVLNEFGEIEILKKSDLEFGYRSSRIQKTGYIVLEIELLLNREEPRLIIETMQKFHCSARKSNPGVPVGGECLQKASRQVCRSYGR